MIQQPVLCLCNYGMVRSKTMRNRLRRQGIMAASMGMMNTTSIDMYWAMYKAGTIIVCNKTNVEENFCYEQAHQLFKENMKEMLKLFAGKILVCDTIGRDIWAKEDHPDLVKICDEYIRRMNERTE